MPYHFVAFRLGMGQSALSMLDDIAHAGSGATAPRYGYDRSLAGNRG
ncbi:Uncharacterised protein [Yersinia kristensenii]|nr:Uncharacterised protein [Yersinia kristensenii]